MTVAVVNNWPTLGVTGRVDVDALTVGGSPVTGGGGAISASSLTLTGTGPSLFGNFTDTGNLSTLSTISNSTVDTGTVLVVVSNSATTSIGSQFIVADNKSANRSEIVARIDDGTGTIRARGKGTKDALVDLVLTTGSGELRLMRNGDVLLGNSGLATSATTGYSYLPSVAGTPTGGAAVNTGLVAVVVDRTGSKLWAFLGGSWKSVTFT